MGPKAPEVAAAIQAAGLPAQPPPGVNAYGMRPNMVLPYPLLRGLAAFNVWGARKFGVACIDKVRVLGGWRAVGGRQPLVLMHACAAAAVAADADVRCAAPRLRPSLSRRC